MQTYTSIYTDIHLGVSTLHWCKTSAHIYGFKKLVKFAKAKICGSPPTKKEENEWNNSE